MDVGNQPTFPYDPLRAAPFSGVFKESLVEEKRAML
jgi:hypothetical protein